MGTFVTLLILAGVIALIVRSMIRDKKSGKSLSCGGDCSRCHSACQGGGARGEEAGRPASHK